MQIANGYHAELLERVVWYFTPRGGYGFAYSVPALVVAARKTRIGIAVVNATTGEIVPRWVNPKNVARWPEHGAVAEYRP